MVNNDTRSFGHYSEEVEDPRACGAIECDVIDNYDSILRVNLYC